MFSQIFNPYYPRPSGITNEEWLPQFPSMMPPSIPFLARYRPDGWIIDSENHRMQDNWPVMTNEISIGNAVNLLYDTSTCTLGFSASLTQDWNYTGYQAGDYSNGSLDFSFDSSFTFNTVANFNLPRSGVVAFWDGDEANAILQNPRVFPTVIGSTVSEYYPTTYNFLPWNLWVTGAGGTVASGVTIDYDIGLKFARNESGNVFRMAVQSPLISMTITQDVYATVTAPTYDEYYNIATPTQFSFYTVPHGAPAENDSDYSFGAMGTYIYICDNYSSLGYVPVASGTLTVAGVTLAWGGYVNNSLGNGGFSVFTWSGSGVTSFSPSLSFD